MRPIKLSDFIVGNKGQWCLIKMSTVAGEPIEKVSHLRMAEHNLIKSNAVIWTLRGFNSNVRYAEKAEKKKLLAAQEGLGRPQATCAALIPIRKTEKWWELHKMSAELSLKINHTTRKLA